MPRARTAAVSTFSVAPTLGKSRRMSAPCSPAGRLGDEEAVGDVDCRPERLEPRRVQVEPARPDRVTPGHGHVRRAAAGHQRAQDRGRGPQGAHEVVVRPVADLVGNVDPDHACRRVVVDGAAEAPQQLGHDGDVEDRDVGQTRATSRQEGRPWP